VSLPRESWDHHVDARIVLATISGPPDIEVKGVFGDESEIADLVGELHLLLLRASGRLTLVLDEYRDYRLPPDPAENPY
jgi:hypothetical protein